MAGVPTGTVRFRPNGVEFFRAVPVGSDGTATLNTSLAGMSSLVVSYSGDANFAPTNSTSYPIVISSQPSTVTVAPASSTVPVGTNVDLTATVHDGAGVPVPGAAVSISPGNATGTTGNDGTATLTVTCTVPGTVTYTVTANGITNPGSATVTYMNVNSAPTASPRSATTDEDTPVTVTPLGSDVDGNTLTYAVTPAHARLRGGHAARPSLHAERRLLWADSFTYTRTTGP